jgi:hypothetical protein
MKRTLMTALVSTSLLVAPACKGDKADGAKDGAAAAEGAKEGEAKPAEGEEKKAEEAKAEEKKAAAPAASAGDPTDALSMLPDGAFLAFSIDVGGAQRIPVMGEDLIEQAIKDPDDKATYAAMRECGLTINLMRRMTMGGEEKKGGMAIIDGKGIGEKSKAECMAKWLEKEKGHKYETQDGDGFTQMKRVGDDALLYLVGSDRIIFTDSKYAEKVEAMIAGKGAKAVDGSLAPALALADKSATIMGVMAVSEEERAKMGPDAAAFKEMTGAAFAGSPNGDGVKFDVKIGLPDAAKAEAAKGLMSRKFDEIKPMAGMFGIPPNVANGVVFAVDGSAATASMSLSAADLEQLKKVAEAQAAGMPAGGMPPGGMPPGAMPPGAMPGGKMPAPPTGM